MVSWNLNLCLYLKKNNLKPKKKKGLTEILMQVLKSELQDWLIMLGQSILFFSKLSFTLL